MTTLKGKIDFALLVSATDANPNGDPLKKNSTHFLLQMPMPENLQGFSWLAPAPARWTGRAGS